MKAKARDIIIRAAKTFVQAFLSYLTVDAFFGITDLNAAKKVALSLVLGAVAAGISAVWNLFINWLNSYIEGLEAKKSENVVETYTEDEYELEDDSDYEIEDEEDGEDYDGE